MIRISIKALALLEAHADPAQVSRMRREQSIAAAIVRHGVTRDVQAEVRRWILDRQIATCLREDMSRGGGGASRGIRSSRRRSETLRRKAAQFDMAQRMRSL